MTRERYMQSLVDSLADGDTSAQNAGAEEIAGARATLKRIGILEPGVAAERAMGAAA